MHGPSLSPSRPPPPPPEPVQPSCFAGLLCSSIPVATHFQIGQEPRRGARKRGTAPASSPGRRLRLSPASLGSPGRAALAPPPNSRTNLLAGRQEGAAVSGGGPRDCECAPLGGAGRRGAGAALLRPRGERAQPDAARLCPRRRRGRRALPDMLSPRACPRGRYQEPAAAGESERSRQAAVARRLPNWKPREKGGRGAAKNSCCGSHSLNLKRSHSPPALGCRGPECATC